MTTFISKLSYSPGMLSSGTMLVSVGLLWSTIGSRVIHFSLHSISPSLRAWTLLKNSSLDGVGSCLIASPNNTCHILYNTHPYFTHLDTCVYVCLLHEWHNFFGNCYDLHTENYQWVVGASCVYSNDGFLHTVLMQKHFFLKSLKSFARIVCFCKKCTMFCWFGVRFCG